MSGGGKTRRDKKKEARPARASVSCSAHNETPPLTMRRHAVNTSGAGADIQVCILEGLFKMAAEVLMMI